MQNQVDFLDLSMAFDNDTSVLAQQQQFDETAGNSPTAQKKKSIIAQKQEPADFYPVYEP